MNDRGVTEPAIRCRKMKLSDKAVLLEWFKSYYREEFPGDFLPETGIVAEISGEAAVMIPVYFEGSSSVAVLGHCIFCPGVRGKLVVKAVKAAIEFSKLYVSEKGKKYVVSIFGRNSINRIADRCGFVDADKIEEKFYYLGGE